MSHILPTERALTAPAPTPQPEPDHAHAREVLGALFTSPQFSRREGGLEGLVAPARPDLRRGAYF